MNNVKGHTMVIAERLGNIGLNARAARMKACSSIITAMQCTQCDRTYYVAARCRDRLCPICGSIRARTTAKILREKTLDALENGGELVLLTLTVKNCKWEDLGSTLRMMNMGWNRIRRWRHTRRGVMGTIRTLEITRGADNTAHPHYHVIMHVNESFWKEYKTTTKWEDAWKKALGINYIPIIDIRKCDIKTIKYIAKYITKTDEIKSLDNNALMLYCKAIKSVKSITTSGTFQTKQAEVEKEERLMPNKCSCGGTFVPKQVMKWDDHLYEFVPIDEALRRQVLVAQMRKISKRAKAQRRIADAVAANAPNA